MRPLLKLSKHRLPVHRPLEALEVLIQQRHLLLGITALREEIFHQEVFIDRRCHLGDENGIVGILLRLMVVREVAVHGVAHLMRDRRHRVERPGEIREDVRLRAVGAVRVRATFLAPVRIYIDPMLPESTLDRRAIVVAERMNRIQDHRLRLFIAVAALHTCRERRIEIIVVKLGYPEDLLAKGHIAIHERHPLMHRRDEMVTNRGRNAFSESIHRLRRLVVPHPRLGDIRLYLAGIRRCKCMNMILVALVEATKCIFTQRTVLRGLQQDEVRTVQLMLLTRTVLHRIEEKIRVL